MMCIEFQQSLDEGCASQEMIAHAKTCAACDRALADSEELERLLAVRIPARVDAGFNDAVMRRIQATPRAAIAGVPAEPIIPLSVALAIVLAFLRPALTIPTAMILAPLLFALSWGLFRVFERMTTPELPPSDFSANLTAP